jgi:signal transduction histidine kinase
MASEQLEVPDALLDSRFCENPMVLEAPGVRSYLGTVLEPEANMRIGTLCVIDTEPRGFSEDVKASLLQIGKAISSLLTSHREKLQLIDYAFDIKAQNIEMLDLADSLRKSVKELTAAEKAKGEFLSIISHELRTPLTLVKGSLGLMKNSAVIADEQKAQRLVNVAYDSNERLLSLIEDILLIQKLDRDKSQMPLDRVDLAESINTEVSKCSGETQSREITLTVSGVEQPCLVKGDKGQLDRVVASILSNALKFSKQGGNVKVTLLSSGTGPQILVEDDGVGISEDSDERVFGLFSQVDSSDTRSRNGAGLGMYISKEILKRHNATINYKSELGVGTTFSVNFPEQVLQ